MSELLLGPGTKTKVATATPQTVDEARATLFAFFSSSEGRDRVFRLQASVARRILNNEESRLEAERLQAIRCAIKSLKRLRT